MRAIMIGMAAVLMVAWLATGCTRVVVQNPPDTVPAEPQR